MKFSWKRSNVGKLDTVVRSIFYIVGQGFGQLCDRASAKMLGENRPGKSGKHDEHLDFFVLEMCLPTPGSLSWTCPGVLGLFWTDVGPIF